MKIKFSAVIFIIMALITGPAYAQPDPKPSSVKKNAPSNKKKPPSAKKKTNNSKKVVSSAAVATPASVSAASNSETISPKAETAVLASEVTTPPLEDKIPSSKKPVPTSSKRKAPAQNKIANQSIKDANNAIGIQYINTNVNYTETHNGIIQDTEKGNVPGFALNFSMMRDLYFGNDYIAASYSQNKGSTNYVGSLLGAGGAYGSVKSTSPATIEDYSIRYGKGFEMTDQSMLTPFIEIGSHQWKRDLGSYKEAYTNNYYAGGLIGQISPAKNWVLSASGMYGKTTSSNISLSGPTAQLFPGGSLGNSDIYKFSLGVDYAFSRNFHSNLSAAYSSFKYGRSAVLNGFLEPDSTTKYITFGVGASYNF